VAFPNLAPTAITGFAVRPDINRLVVSIKWDKKGQPGATRLVMCDTALGKVVSEWQVAGHQAAIDLSPDARTILTTHFQAGRERTNLRLWTISADNQLRRSVWTPFLTPRPDGFRVEPGEQPETTEIQEIRWAAFVGPDRLVAASRSGQIRVFETKGGKPLTVVEGSACRPTLTPDGTKVAFLTGDSVALLDPIAGAVVGTRWVGPIPQRAALAFSPDGARLAIGGNGKILLMSLTTGDIQEVLRPGLQLSDRGAHETAFGWAGNKCVLVDGHLYDLQFPVAAWDYVGAEQFQFHGSQVWACVRPAGGTTATIAAYTLPHADAWRCMGANADRERPVAFKTGDAVQIDVSGIPENRRGDVQTALEQRLKGLGYQVDPKAPATLFAAVETGGTRTNITYSGYESVGYQKTAATLRLVVSGKEVWSLSWANEPPFSIRIPIGVSVADHLKPFSPGESNYNLFAKAPLPAWIPVSQSPAPLGTCELNSDRMKAWLAW
jgi:hypothetical protein